MKRDVTLNKQIFSVGVLSLLICNLSFASQLEEESEYRHGDSEGNAVYRVQIHNDTQTQWFSPYLCVLHHNRLSLFQEGQAPSSGQAIFAEDGFSGVLRKELLENPLVFSVVESGPGLIPPDATLATHIKGPENARLTCAAMPVTTNDVLTVVQNVKTPKHVNESYYYSSTEWDIGSEEDNYSASTMPEDSAHLTPESADNPVTISENVVFGEGGRPEGVPTLLSPFTRAYLDSGNATSEGTMSVFEHYVGSSQFPTEIYGWSGFASHFLVTRVE